MSHKVLAVTVPFGRLSVEAGLAPHLEAKATWEYRSGSASIPAETGCASAFRCSITSEPRCCIAMEATVFESGAVVRPAENAHS